MYNSLFLPDTFVIVEACVQFKTNTCMLNNYIPRGTELMVRKWEVALEEIWPLLY